MKKEQWDSAVAYEQFVGRWSRPVAREFISWLAAPRGLDWLDVGCGSGCLSETILAAAEPRSVEGVDLSPAYVEHTRGRLTDARAAFSVGDAQHLPQRAASRDAIVSGLMLNFVPKADVAVHEMTRVVRPGGLVAAYVWDYAHGMQFIRIFWDAACAEDPTTAELDEGRRFPLCQPDALRAHWQNAGLESVETRAVDVPTRFTDFDDYWTPFLGGQGPGPTLVMSLDETRRARLRNRIRSMLPGGGRGPIELTARAWAVKGRRPNG